MSDNLRVENNVFNKSLATKEEIKSIDELNKVLKERHYPNSLIDTLPKNLVAFLEIYKNGSGIKNNILLVCDNEKEIEIAEIITSFLHYQNACSQNLILNYDYSTRLGSENYVVLFNDVNLITDDLFLQIKQTNKNIINLLLVDIDTLEKYKEFIFLLFPYVILNKYDKNEMINIIDNKIKSCGFTYDNDFINKGIKISNGIDAFDLELSSYLVSKMLNSKDKNADIKEFEAHSTFKDWRQVDKLKLNPK